MFAKKHKAASPPGIFFKLAIWTIIALIAQQFVSLFIHGFDWLPSMLLVAVIYSGFYYGEIYGASFGFFAAFLYCCLFLVDFKTAMILWTLIGWTAGYLKRFFFFDSFMGTIIPLAFFLAVDVAVVSLLSAYK